METIINNHHNYKRTSMGLIPNDWEVTKICDGTTYVDYRGKTPTKTEEGIMLLTARNIKVGYIDYNISNEYISPDDYSSIMSRGLPEIGDVLFTTEAPMGNVAQVDKVHIALAQRVIKFSAKTNIITNDYLKFYFLSEKFQKLLDEKSTGGTAKGIKGSTLHKMILVIPPLPEQEKIAQILSTWDVAIDDCKMIIENLKFRNKGLSQKLLSGKMRVKGFEETKWNNQNLGHVTENFSRRNKLLIDARIYSVTNSNGFVLQSNHFSREVAGSDLNNYKIIRRNEFAYNPARINVGSIAYFSEDIGVISSLYVCFKTNDLLHDGFLSEWLKLEKTNHDINRYGEGGVRVYLWYDLFKTIKISFPDLKEQYAIVNILEKAAEELNQYQQKLEKLQSEKKGLMQQLLTGKVRVKI